MTDSTAPFSPFKSSQSKNSQRLESAFRKLSSGKRIGSAADDPAGVAVAAKLQFSVDTLNQLSRNFSDSVSRIEVADSALEQVTNLSGRLGELATQAANGTYSAEQRAAIQGEYTALTEEIGRIAGSTEFNGQKLLTGTPLTTLLGTESGGNSQLTIPSVDLPALVSGLSSQSLGTQAGAQAAIDQVRSFAEQITTARGGLGNAANRLTSARDVTEVQEENLRAAQSRIEDVDVAEEVAELLAARIRRDADTALQAAGTPRISSVQALLGGRSR